MKQKKVLITAFKGKNNSSAILVKKIRVENIEKFEFTNSFETSERELRAILDKAEPDYILFFGEKPETSKIELEAVARRWHRKIKTVFALRKLADYLKRNGFGVAISKDAGQYLCNNIYYEGLKRISKPKRKTRAAFVHVPSLESGTDVDKLAKVVSNYIKKFLQ